MKYAVFTAIAALGFASAAAAQDSYTKDTIMTRSVPAQTILEPRDRGIVDGGYVQVTVGERMVEEAGDLLNPRETAIATDGTVNSYVFGGSFENTVEGAYSFR